MNRPKITSIIGVRGEAGRAMFIDHVVFFDDGRQIKVRESVKKRGQHLSRAEIAEMAIEYRRTRATMGGE
ncbi:hypothetical protein [Acetonema longum]|uniref:Uncharacterized protein n=1 Tax=Acetonema longum DSM 6540 TaxID=1009370 RepID=F7NK70_9FIRM|nr:hypothetical protein [Acetonema longum]EGO63511.1 hypothetical protein ALO_12416 [Acetonema longum DSM 6540]